MPINDFFHARLDQMIDLHHPLAVLANRLPWRDIEAVLAPAFEQIPCIIAILSHCHTQLSGSIVVSLTQE